jgi:predicted nucleotidyltransferase
MFTPEERTRLRDALIAAARADPSVTAAELTGSAASGAEDRWSDIDVALAVAGGADQAQVVADWTARMYRECGAVHHVDVYRGDILFRVFLLADTLQVDIAFWPEAEFGAVGPTFRLLFGATGRPPPPPTPSAAGLAGMAWLYALHVRSSIARGRWWQAEYMLSGMRDHVLALACLRHGLPTGDGRGFDRLPPEVSAACAGGLVRSLDVAELRRAFGVVTDALLAEVGRSDADLAHRLNGALKELTAEESPSAGGGGY